MLMRLHHHKLMFFSTLIKKGEDPLLAHETTFSFRFLVFLPFFFYTFPYSCESWVWPQVSIVPQVSLIYHPVIPVQVKVSLLVLSITDQGYPRTRPLLSHYQVRPAKKVLHLRSSPRASLRLQASKQRQHRHNKKNGKELDEKSGDE